MEVIKHMFRDMRRVNNKKMFVVAAFSLAVVAALGLGLATKSGGVMAASVRDSGHNPIINTGSIGCLTAKECIADMKANNPSDLKKIYAHFGLAPSEYARFEKTAKMGVTTDTGDVIVDGQTVVKGAWSTGRDNFGTNRVAYQINGKTYYKSQTQHSFAEGVKSLDTLVMFRANGTVETAIITACGNPVWGDNVVPAYSCDKLNKVPVAGKKDTYRFNTDTSAINNATIVQVEYNFGDGTPKQIVKNPREIVEHTYAMPSKTTSYTASVKVLVKLPGGSTKIVTAIKCKTLVTVVVPPAPTYACTNLIAAKLDTKKQKFGFSTRISYANGAVPKSVDFTADGVTTTGVVTKDAAGNYYKEYTFTDTADHKVSAVVHFTANDKDVVSTQKCEAIVNSEKTPMCTIPGKEMYPPNAPECQEECKPGIPVGDDRCNPPAECKPGIPVDDIRCVPEEETPPPEEVEECKPGVPTGSADCEEEVLPNTGAGNILGLFAGTSLLGAAGHRMFKSRLSRKG